MTESGNRIRGLDGVRAFAVIAVVLSHIGLLKSLRENGLMSDGVYYSVRGAVGVEAFFVLSGFLITHLLIREHRKTGDVSLRNFFVRRVLRIFPVYYLMLVLTLLIHLSGAGATDLKHLAMSFLYISNYVPQANNSPMLDHTWSLAVEEHFYLLWPAVFLLFAARLRLLAAISVAFIAGALGLAGFLLQNPGLAGGENFFRWSHIAGFDIMIGCAAALFINIARPGGVFASVTASRPALALGVLFWFNQATPFFDGTITHVLLRGVGFALIILWIYGRQRSRVVAALEWTPLAYVGQISYGVYIWQGFYLTNAPDRPADMLWPLPMEIGVFLLMATAPLSYHFLERPILRMKDRFRKARPRPGARPATPADAKGRLGAKP